MYAGIAVRLRRLVEEHPKLYGMHTILLELIPRVAYSFTQVDLLSLMWPANSPGRHSDSMWLTR